MHIVQWRTSHDYACPIWLQLLLQIIPVVLSLVISIASVSSAFHFFWGKTHWRRVVILIVVYRVRIVYSLGPLVFTIFICANFAINLLQLTFLRLRRWVSFLHLKPPVSETTVLSLRLYLWHWIVRTLVGIVQPGLCVKVDGVHWRLFLWRQLFIRLWFDVHVRLRWRS